VLASRVRRVLGAERVERGDEGYRLRYDRLDADDLATLVAEIDRRRSALNVRGAAAAARVALGLVRGDPSALGTEADWVSAELADLARLVHRARTTAAEALLAEGSWLDAAAVASTLAARDPFDEHAVRLLMRAHVAGARPAAALAAYAALRQRLADELGSEPSAETAALHLAVLRGEPAEPRRPGRAAEPQPLVGRAADLGRLDELADRAGTQVIALLGEAGIGKSSLLRAWRATRTGTVLSGSCGPLERSVPLDALLTALTAHLRALEPADAAALLEPDALLLTPLLLPAGRAPATPALERGLGPALLFAALTGLLARLAGDGRVSVLLDDVHRAGPALADFLAFAVRREVPAVFVVAARPGEGEAMPATAAVELGPLDEAATAELVGAARAADLYARSLGNPLLLTELAAGTDEQLPASLVAAVSARCEGLGPAAAALRAAAVIGPRVDVGMLAQVLDRPVVEVLDAAELAVRRRLLVDDGGTFAFRHELVRLALAAEASAARRAFLHREACRILSGRDDADPAEVAEHARLGGEPALAARHLRAAAARAAERFDHATAERLLTEALVLHRDDAGRLDRARIRIRRADYAGAAADAADAAGAEAEEVAAWAAYFDRRFDDALQHAETGRALAENAALRARCLTVGGRTLHARGDLRSAERLLAEAVEVAGAADRTTAQAWLGVLRAHQSLPEEALRLLRPAAARAGVEFTTPTLHALLFAGHAQALAGAPAAALGTLARYTAEVERRQVPRFSGRGVNFAGWVLRNVAAVAEGVDRHHEALAAAQAGATRDVRVAALEDLAEAALHAGDLDAAAKTLDEAAAGIGTDLVFGWRLQMKADLLRSRLALARGEDEVAATLAGGLSARAAEAGVPRYAAPAALVAQLARSALGQAVDLAETDRLLEQIARAAAMEAWWWCGDAGAALGVAAWLDRAETLAAQLARNAGAYADTLRAEAERRLRGWRTARS
jgi:DNA-binding SARP family transcriptional activator